MGEFQLDEELGRGNYGAVKKVLHKPTNVIMAMKVCIVSSNASNLRFISMLA
jgi:mitogen-activated protein kinase kinase